MTSDNKGTVKETISLRLASALNIKLPPKDGRISLTDEQYEILKRTDKAGNTQLMIAAEQGERASVEFLIHHGADVNYRNKKTQQRAIDLAWDQGHYGCMLSLLEADSNFPETLDLVALLNDDTPSEELKSFVKEIEQLHQWIREGNVEKVQSVILKGKNLRLVNVSGQSAMETLIRYGSDRVFASVLGLSFPIPTEKISLPENKARLLAITNTFGDTPLLSAAREGKESFVDILLRCGADVNFQSTSGKTAADLAWENCHFMVATMLLESDSDFPQMFSLDRLTDGHGEKELKELANSRSALHEMIRFGKLQEVKTIVREKVKPSKHYLNIQGQSALYTAIEEKQYDIYAFLKSVGVYFKDKKEEICLENLRMEEKVDLKCSMIEYFPKIADSHILFLVSKSKSSCPHSDFRNTVYNIFKQLDDIPLISQILQVIQYADYFEIIFDFDREDIYHMEPRHSSSTRGATDYRSGRLYVGFKMATPEQEAECLGTLAHELAHLAMQITFQNNCNPYEKSDEHEKSHFVNKIVSRVREVCDSEDVNDIIKMVFTNYKDPDAWPSELIVRVPQILAQYGEEEGSEIISTHAPLLLSYFTDNILPKYETFVKQNFLIKPRNMVRTLNQYLGRLNELRKANISFKHFSYEMEFFDNTEQNILLVNTSNTWLSSLNILQALQSKKDYSLPNSYLVIRLDDFEDFPEEIIDAFSSDANNLMVVECHKKGTGKLISKLLKDVARVFCLIKKKKVVLIVHREYVAEVTNTFKKERLLSKMIEHIDKELSLKDLSNESQKELLDRKVMFQGVDTVLKSILHEGTTDIVDGDTLVRLINNREIVIGQNVRNLGEIKEYYIERSFNIDKEISLDIFKDETLSDLFFIGGSNHGFVKHYHNVQVSTEDNREEEEKIFSSLCENYANRNIHYLRLTAGKLFWVKTKGSVSSLRNYRRTGSSIHYSESDLIDDDSIHSPVIISDTAGMGKSTVITKLALEIKRKFPFSWILRIDLNNYNHELETELNKKGRSLNNIDLDLALNFLSDKILQVPTKFEKNVIKESFKKTGNVFVLFDGFDEISPVYEDIIMNFIQVLQNSKIKKIFVTCRPYVAELLEEQFSSLSFVIEPLSNNAKKEFLVKFWNKRFNLNKAYSQNAEERKILEQLAETLIVILSVSINENQQSFTGVPLHLRMIGEIIPESVETEGVENISLFSDRVNFSEIKSLFDLYKYFIDKKYDIYKIEKMKPSTAIAAADVENARQTFIKNHQKIAVYSLLPSEQHTILLSEEEIEYLEEFLDRIFEGKEKTGIIDGVIKVSKKKGPHFLHLTFAEYFVASFLSSKLRRKNHSKEAQKLMLTNILVLQTYEGVRHFLNEFMENISITGDVLDRYGSSIHDLWTSNPKSLRNMQEQTALHVAVIEGNKNVVRFFLLSLHKQRELLEKIINDKDKKGGLALHVAVENGDIKVLRLLVENGANVSAMDMSGQMALDKAAFLGNLEIVQILMSKITNDSSEAKLCKKIIHNATNFGELKLVEWLLMKARVDVDYKDTSGRSLLHLAAKYNNFAVVKWLLETGSDIHITDEEGRTAMHEAASTGEQDIEEWLAQRDVIISVIDGISIGIREITIRLKPNKSHYVQYLRDKGFKVEGMGLGKFVVHVESLASVMLLLQSGANVNAVDMHGRTPLYYAIPFDRPHVFGDAIVKFLIKPLEESGAGADIHIVDDEGMTLLHKLTEDDHINVMKWLLEKITDSRKLVNVADTNGFTPLHYAALHYSPDTVMTLAAYGADSRAVNKYKRTALHEASVFNNSETFKVLVQLMVKQGYQVLLNDVDIFDATALHYATVNGNIQNMKYLTQNGADINIQNCYGCTPLHLAASNGELEVVKYLVERNALDLRDAEGYTALDLAHAEGNNDVITFLENSQFVYGNREVDCVSLSNLTERVEHLNTVEVQATEDSSTA